MAPPRKQSWYSNGQTDRQEKSTDKFAPNATEIGKVFTSDNPLGPWLRDTAFLLKFVEMFLVRDWGGHLSRARAKTSDTLRIPWESCKQKVKMPVSTVYFGKMKRTHIAKSGKKAGVFRIFQGFSYNQLRFFVYIYIGDRNTPTSQCISNSKGYKPSKHPSLGGRVLGMTLNVYIQPSLEHNAWH